MRLASSQRRDVVHRRGGAEGEVGAEELVEVEVGVSLLSE